MPAYGPFDLFDSRNPLDAQGVYHALRKQHGDEAVRKAIVGKLRQAADLIEAGDFPDLFGCRVENLEPKLLADGFIEGFQVIVSDVWPG